MTIRNMSDGQRRLVVEALVGEIAASELRDMERRQRQVDVLRANMGTEEPATPSARPRAGRRAEPIDDATLDEMRRHRDATARSMERVGLAGGHDGLRTSCCGALIFERGADSQLIGISHGQVIDMHERRGCRGHASAARPA